MEKRKRNLTTDLMFLTIVPLLALGIIVLVVSSAVIYSGLRGRPFTHNPLPAIPGVPFGG